MYIYFKLIDLPSTILQKKIEVVFGDRNTSVIFFNSIKWGCDPTLSTINTIFLECFSSSLSQSFNRGVKIFTVIHAFVFAK